jgi:hypothetical protein
MIKLVWLTLLALHAGVAAMWWWLMPHGFPTSSMELWLNEVAPLVVIALLATALLARGRLSAAILPPVLAAIPIFWMAFGISARLTFVDSFESLWKLAFIGGAVLAGIWVQQFRGQLRPVWLVPLLTIPAALSGWLLPDWQRAPEPTTAPAGAALGDVPTGMIDHKLIKLTRDAQVRVEDGRVVLRRDPLVLNVQPLLSFANRSPDRCWTALAPDALSFPTTRKLIAKVHDGSRWRLFYKDEDTSVLELGTRDGAVQVEARSRLPSPVYSHNNSFAELTIQGHHKLSVSFSPLPGKRIEIPPATAPTRFAYVDAARTFHVAEASQLRHGPFTEIAAAPLSRTDPLALTIYDGDKPAFTVELTDWAAQASTAPSATAGWRIPVNAIELVRGGEPETAPALIRLTLADTSIGRGTQTVGHAAGVYRNRLSITMPSP